MTSLTLKHGPQLVLRDWKAETDSNKGEWLDLDVTAEAHSFLFDKLSLSPDVTLSDIFGLLDACPPLKSTFVRYFAQALCDEAAKGPIAPKDSDPQDILEYLELYQQWYLNTGTQSYSGTNFWSFHAIGVLQPTERPDMGIVAGQRIQWSIALSSLRELLHLPVRVNTMVKVCEDDMDASGYGKELMTIIQRDISLSEVIRGVLWELSFYGTPEDTQAVADELTAQTQAIDSGLEELLAHDDVFESLSKESDLAGAQLLFESIGELTPYKVEGAMRKLADTDNLVTGLLAEVGPSIVVKAEYHHLTAREARKLFRLAGYPDDTSKGHPND